MEFLDGFHGFQVDSIWIIPGKQYFTLPRLFHVESMEWGVDSMEWLMDSILFQMDSIWTEFMEL